MATIHVPVTVRNPADLDQCWEGVFLVDTGATDCMVPRPDLEAIGIQSVGEREYEMANGTRVTYGTAVAQIEFMGEILGARIILGEPDIEPLLGITALESAGLEIDPVTQRLKRLPAIRLKQVDSASRPLS
ncbi:MAG: clan AA aspartic protease [Acidimicrobiia bacterium]|nr:clan AA aspartic protease [Acidimicrobiia bacterium]MYF26823.1 clan AA aspartic protease [Acidimicrobiia bacterium]MYH56360.1 clan AA aspartic protease [Acidimicrobiia bacterium]